MKEKIKLIKSWLLIGLHASPFNFIFAIVSRIGLAAIYYFIMIITSNLINSFGINDETKIKYYTICLFVFALGSVFLLIIQDISDARFNVLLKKIYTEEITQRMFDIDIINLQRQEFQNELTYATQAMNGTQLFSPTLSIINMLLGSIANILIVIKMINHVQGMIIFVFLLIIFIIGLSLGQKRNKRFFQKEDKLIPIQRQKSNYSNILNSNQYFQENFIYNFSDYIMGKWNSKYLEINKTQQSENRKINFESLIFDLLITFILGITLIFLIKTQITFTAGSVIILIGAIMSLLQGIRGISSFIASFMQGVTTLDKVEKLRKYNFNGSDLNKLMSKIDLDNIAIHNLTFTYPNSKFKTISNISHKIEKGKVTAIVGENGCGKTTLIKLLSGIYKPDSGGVFINGINSWNVFNDKQLDLGISIVFQDYGRYQGITLDENISLSNTKINNNNNINKSIFSEFNNQYDEIVGNSFGGIDFSGGQWQKIALMRALSKNSEILIFDEPTASLDPISEKKIFEWLIKETSGKTLIIVTHRLGSIRNADSIIVMEKGEIIEQGTHENLILNQGKYFQMFESQAQWYKED